MDPELKKQLDEIRALAKDNHDMLRALRRHQWWGSVMTVVFWTIITLAPFYLYQQYVQPLIAKVSGSEPTTSGFNLPTSADAQKLINSIKAGL